MVLSPKRISKVSVMFLSLGTLVVTMSACGIIKNMDEMHDATVAMNEKMAKTNEGLLSTRDKTGELSSKMDTTNAGVAKTNLYIAATYYDLRQADAKKVRSDALMEMERAASPEGKIAAAGAYFMAMEFQLWKGFGTDNFDRRLELYDESMKELFRDVQNYKEKERPINPASTDPRMLNLEAIAVTLHFVNSNAAIDPKTGKADSALSLIEDTLSRRAEIDSMDPADRARLPEYQKEILAYAEDAIYLLQLRANFLGAMVLSKISDIQEGGLTGLLLKAHMLFRPWDAQLTGRNAVQLDTYKVWMDEANRVTGELKSMGLDPRLDSKLLRIYRNMRFDASQISAAGSSKAASNVQLAAQGLGVAIDRYREK